MTKKEIDRIIIRERNHIKSTRQKIMGLQYDIKATRKEISFWKTVRKTAPEA